MRLRSPERHAAVEQNAATRPLTAFLRQQLARITSTGEFIPQIDGLRFLAVMLVFGHHAFAHYLEHTHRLGTQSLPRDWALIYPRSPLVSWGLDLAFGVPLFCTISGFVLSIPFARSGIKGAPPPSRKAYFLRRLVRLEPPYIIAMVFWFLTIVLPWHQTNPAAYFDSYFRAFFPHLLASLGYLHALVYGQPSWINGLAWTLEIEVQFYLVLPWLAEIFRSRPAKWRRATLVALIFASALFAKFIVGAPQHSRLSLSLAVQLHFFLAGLLLADLYLDAPPILRLGPRIADTLAITSAALLVVVVHREPKLAWTEPFLIAGFYFGVFSGAWTGRIFRFPLLTIFGGMGYTIYLYHVFLIEWLLWISVRLFPPAHALWWDSGVQILLMLPLVLVICAVLFFATERPFMILSREVTRRLRRTAARAVA
jgi:peptidoglycan/LPS O-acetylase OafA/YrhL